jgi:hydrogenase expression/formation protein HypC
VTRVDENAQGMTMGTVDFAGIRKEVCLAYLPDVSVGEYVIVHVGFAISRVSEEEAQFVFKTLREWGELAELDIPRPD